MSDGNLSPSQQALCDLWDEHVRHEFETRSSDHTLDTMVEEAYVNHVPVLTGGFGKQELGEFYARYFIPQMPEDTEMIPVSRTVGDHRLVDEMVFKFTHTVRMDWLVPGVEPTGRPVEMALVVIVDFQGRKLASERIYWDQASVLAQLGLLDTDALPIAGVETARRVLDPSVPCNKLIERAERRRSEG